jgi:uracil-DNA glycosylase
MLLQPIWDWLEGDVLDLRVEHAGPRPLFNPYLDINPAVDRPGAIDIRRENLRGYLGTFTCWPEILVIGEAPGWRGCRFSGVPFTSEAQLCQAQPGIGLPFDGSPSSLGERPHTEATATVFWQVMRAYHPRFLAWNSLPFHPHAPAKPLSNRTPSLAEIRLGGEMVRRLAELLQPRLVIAVGKSAQFALQCLGLAAIHLRHPGRGGVKTFATGIQAIFETQSALSGSPTIVGATIGYNSGTILAPREDQNLPL